VKTVTGHYALQLASRRPRLGLRVHFYIPVVARTKVSLSWRMTSCKIMWMTKMSSCRLIAVNPPLHSSNEKLGFAQISWVVLLEAGGSGPLGPPPAAAPGSVTSLCACLKALLLGVKFFSYFYCHLTINLSDSLAMHIANAGEVTSEQSDDEYQSPGTCN